MSTIPTLQPAVDRWGLIWAIWSPRVSLLSPVMSHIARKTVFGAPIKNEQGTPPSVCCGSQSRTKDSNLPYLVDGDHLGGASRPQGEKRFSEQPAVMAGTLTDKRADPRPPRTYYLGAGALKGP